ncbi:hypothetical protein GPUN_2454 [Glaciecola punicea ACAM 611]|jgi:hypothetical protein|uniref:Uncharacterized protein n=1 Tax=Glaciecola punicea ACAM 611 TaxID=1121923 RepID=H5TE42_9ALTE|nr:hypothetical protein [Glaciecola punicea]OFA31105.1 hypothetical protein BAE46_09020 [Glaciecola punicea]GAB56569.1 hypothetical protein GPUN_2454 [Glaciecola punicea ACAM 611]
MDWKTFTAQSRQAQVTFLMKLAEVSLRAAVIESFRALESGLEKAFVMAYPELNASDFRSPAQMQKQAFIAKVDTYFNEQVSVLCAKYISLKVWLDEQNKDRQCSR